MRNKANDMTDSELLESLIHSTFHSAGFVLKSHRRVLPFCVQFYNAEDPHVDFYSPHEPQPQASFEEQFAVAEAKARKYAERPETCALALVTEVSEGEQRFMIMQADTRTAVRVLRYPLRKTWLGWTIGKAEETRGLVVERLFVE
ncbi:MAG: hypothetical protein ACM3VW_07870 [Bacteroidota bacterium]